jgi:hypothetical protein
MPARRKVEVATELAGEWTLPASATLGSSLRAKGILNEVRAHLPVTARRLLHNEAGVLALRVPQGEAGNFQLALAIVARALQQVDSLPVIPREVEDILTISTSERHRWLKDGRLQSAGTRTVKMRGRARKITFHVFDPRHIEDVLDRDMASLWREQDAATAADNRRRAAGKAAMNRARKAGLIDRKPTGEDGVSGDCAELQGWDEFEDSGLLR